MLKFTVNPPRKALRLFRTGKTLLAVLPALVALVAGIGTKISAAKAK
jgi:hypothetical protein